MARSNQSVDPTHFSPRQIAERWMCSVDYVLARIRAGELKASNLGSAMRPKWRISTKDEQAFLDDRSNTEPPTITPKRCRKPAKEWV